MNTTGSVPAAFFDGDRRVSGDAHEHIGLHRHELLGMSRQPIERAILVPVSSITWRPST